MSGHVPEVTWPILLIMLIIVIMHDKISVCLCGPPGSVYINHGCPGLSEREREWRPILSREVHTQEYVTDIDCGGVLTSIPWI